MKCENVLLTFGLFFSKCTFLRLKYFFLLSTYSVNSILSVVARMYKIHVFYEVFFPPCNLSFSYFHSKHGLGDIRSTYQSKLSPK